MKYVATLLAVKDMERSKCFYCEVLGLEVVEDLGENVTLTGGISLQTLSTWKDFVHKQEEEIVFAHNAGEIYFEEENLEEFCDRLALFPDIVYVHPLFEHSWGQRAVRFYDLDGHIIEVGESIASVVKKFVAGGLTLEETAIRMDVPLAYARSWLTQ